MKSECELKIACSTEPSLSSTKEVAVQACKYAQKFILKGSNWVINNTYDKSQQDSSRTAVQSCRDSKTDKYSVEPDARTRKFYHDIKTIKKFSVGNCGELGKLALYYVLHFTKDVRGELYTLEGGDHAFLVVGRKENSLSKDPKTWGEDAYICDAWSDSDTVYPASEYLTKLKNYYYSFSEIQPQGDCHHLEAFDKRKHRLIPAILNTKYLGKVNSPNYLKLIMFNYENKMAATISIMESCDAKIDLIFTYLAGKYSEKNEKHEVAKEIRERLKTNILNAKQDLHYQTAKALKVVEMLESSALETKGEIASPSIGLEKISPYEALRSNLEKSLKTTLRACSDSIYLKEHEKKILMQHRTDNYASKAMLLFKMPTKTESMINPALADADVQYCELLNTFKN